MTKLIILAAGKGERLRPYTNDKPKGMVDLGGKSLLEWQVLTGNKCNITKTIVVKGYLSEKIKLENVTYYTNKKYDTTNMVYTLWKAEEEFNDDVIISYADIIYETSVLELLKNSPHDISVVVDKSWQKYWNKRFDDPTKDAESLKISQKGLITDIGKKINSTKEPDAQYIGLMKFSVNGIHALKDAYSNLKKNMRNEDFSNIYMTDLLQEIINLGYDIHPVGIDRKWLEIDTINDYEVAKNMIEFSDFNIKINE